VDEQEGGTVTVMVRDRLSVVSYAKYSIEEAEALEAALFDWKADRDLAAALRG
jgi:hypothetical protein